MFVTAQNMFTEFLDGINKEHTGTVTPDEFNRLINWSQDELVKNKYTEVEKTQKRIDDLRIIECRDELVNVGVTEPGGEIFELPYSPNSFVTTPGNPNGDNNGYMFLLNVAFKIEYINDKCGRTGISDPIAAKPLRADKEYAIAKDPYNKPTNDRLYYKMLGNTIRCKTGTDSYAVYALIDYLRYPRRIQVPTPQSNVDIPCELPLHIREEIVDVAIRKKLGIYESPRYQQKIAEDSQSIT